jgi:hypothetical protein
MAMAMRQKHKVLPKVFTIEVDKTPIPKASLVTVTAKVNAAKAPRKIKTLGFFIKNFVKGPPIINLPPRDL